SPISLYNASSAFLASFRPPNSRSTSDATALSSAPNRRYAGPNFGATTVARRRPSIAAAVSPRARCSSASSYSAGASRDGLACAPTGAGRVRLTDKPIAAMTAPTLADDHGRHAALLTAALDQMEPRSTITQHLQ